MATVPYMTLFIKIKDGDVPKPSKRVVRCCTNQECPQYTFHNSFNFCGDCGSTIVESEVDCVTRLNLENYVPYNIYKDPFYQVDLVTNYPDENCKDIILCYNPIVHKLSSVTTLDEMIKLEEQYYTHYQQNTAAVAFYSKLKADLKKDVSIHFGLVLTYE